MREIGTQNNTEVNRTTQKIGVKIKIIYYGHAGYNCFSCL
jgi:hypothetical protein